MEIGMLWFDNDKQVDLMTKISRAVQYYIQKYGKTPNICYVNPAMLPEKSEKTGNTAGKLPVKIEIKTSNLVLPNHFWLGINSLIPPAGQNGNFPEDHPQSADRSPALSQAGLT